MRSHLVTRLREIRAEPPRVVIYANEHQEQVAVIQWWGMACGKWALPEFALYAVPNAGAGAQAGQAGKMKAEGVRRGVCDLVLACARGGYHGLYVEMKSRSPGAKVSIEQEAFMAYVVGAGYRAKVCYGAEEAILAIRGYLELAAP